MLKQNNIFLLTSSFNEKQCKSLTVLLLLLLVSSQQTSVSAKTDKESKGTSNTPAIPKSKRMHLPKEVIVIGGGIAGLAAARTITKDRTNFTVKVFEAQKHRYGGRVWTDKLTNMKARGIEVDLGAFALNTKAKDNPLLHLIEDFELETATIDNPQFIIPWQGMTFDGEALSGIRQDALQILGRALNESKSMRSEISVKEAVDIVLGKDDTRESSPGQEMVKCLPTYILGDYSTSNYKPELMDVGYERVLLDGMGEFVDRLASGSSEEPPLHIYLNKAVRQIKVDDEKKKVIVRTTDGLQTPADIVVVAIPSTVLTAEDVIFEPRLPKEYQQATKDLGMAGGSSVIVEFERTFWPEEFGVFIRAVETEGERGHLQRWINIQRLLKKKPVLRGSLLGAAAVSFDELTDKEAQQAVVAVLTDMFGEEAVERGGKIVRFQRSKWMSDPLFRGTGTYPKVGSNTKSWSVLSDPLCPYVYFAGEHTNSEAPGTVYGAYNSGVRVGNQILSHFCNIRREEERKRKELERKIKQEKAKNKTNDDVVIENVEEFEEKEEL